MKFKNTYYLLRHGEALSNVENFISSYPEKRLAPLTEKGIEQIKTTAKEIKGLNIDVIFSSDLLRTKQTAEIISKELNIEPKYDNRLREYNVGVFNGETVDELNSSFNGAKHKFLQEPENGESYQDIQDRVKDFLNSMESEYEGKNILIISHQVPIMFFKSISENLNRDEIISRYLETDKIKNGELIKI